MILVYAQLQVTEDITTASISEEKLETQNQRSHIYEKRRKTKTFDQ